MCWRTASAEAIGWDHATQAFRSTGSSDPDVLYARREELLVGARRMRSLATAQILLGGALSLTIIGAFVGVPAILRGLAARKCAAANTSTIEAAYAEYVRQAAAKRKTTTDWKGSL